MALDIDLLSKAHALRMLKYSQRRIADRLGIERGEVCRLLREIREATAEQYNLIDLAAIQHEKQFKRECESC